MAKKVPLDEFRKALDTYIDGTEVVHITRGGRTVGVYTPNPEQSENWEHLSEPAARVDRMLAEGGLSEKDVEEMLKECEAEQRPKRDE